MELGRPFGLLATTLLFCQYHSTIKPLEQLFILFAYKKDHWKKLQQAVAREATNRSVVIGPPTQNKKSGCKETKGSSKLHTYLILDVLLSARELRAKCDSNTFRKKCHPSGEGYCFKAHMRMRGDLQRENCSNNKTFAPVMEWVTMRMLFSLSIMEGWSTASIDFKNTFAQATLPKAIYMKLPQGHVQANPGDQDKVMKIKKSLYGDCRAANLWCP